MRSSNLRIQVVLLSLWLISSVFHQQFKLITHYTHSLSCVVLSAGCPPFYAILQLKLETEKKYVHVLLKGCYYKVGKSWLGVIPSPAEHSSPHLT